MSVLEKFNIPEEGTVYKQSAPFTARVLENKPLTGEDSGDDVRHIVLDIAGSGMRYLEGQSVGVIPPGTRENGKPHVLRLYSIASSRYADNGKSDTVSLCVKRTIYQDEQGNEVRGVCSNYLCDSRPGDEINISGPTGKILLMPADTAVSLFMIATGTGIAPFRGFLDYIRRNSWRGKVSLFFGVKTGKELLYMNQTLSEPDIFSGSHLTVHTALSREQKTQSGEKMYVQHRIAEQFSHIWESVKSDRACIFICGLKGMEKDIEALFEQACLRDGREWKELKKTLRTEGRWNVEVY